MPSYNPFPLLDALANAIDNGSDARQTLDNALSLIASHFGFNRCAICTVDPIDGKIRISASFGLQPEQIRRGEYLPGEGITGNVISRGEPVYISDIANEPLFLNRTQSRNSGQEALSFICLPMLRSGHVFGSLWVDKPHDALWNPELCLKTLRVAVTMLAPVAHDGMPAHSGISQSCDKFGRFIGVSPCLQQAYAQIIQVSASRLTVLLTGESGTGKELAARTIHEGSPRAGGPFVSINCAALPENLIESELFGHERGAFTGAVQTRKGKFEQADQGTIFLDEIAEMTPPIQAKLLRVLQEHAIERIGSNREQKIDVRVIAATNRNLPQMVANGTFREDLFYRLNVFPIHMPPLRNRCEDIPALAEHFLRSEARAEKRKAPAISREALARLQAYQWPGNIRELQNIIERAFLLSDGAPFLLPEHLPDYLDNPDKKTPDPINLKEKLDVYEKAAIIAALKQSGGHICKASAALGMTERKFSLRLERYGLHFMDFRKKK